MHKALVRSLETGVLAEIGLVAFFVAFVLLVIWAFTLKPSERDAAKQQPLNDADPIFPKTMNGHV
ncbi:MAG: hypothetical protein RhofKO_07230 [Rhodothermales bacterium]